MLILAGMFLACKKNEPAKEQSSLMKTKWKLEGIVDSETGVLTELEPIDCNDCYTIVFDTSSVFFPGVVDIFIGYTTVNMIYGKYEFDNNTRTYHITPLNITEMGDGELCHFFWKIQYFTVKDTFPRVLRLYYNDGKNYLKYKEIEYKDWRLQ